MTLLRGDTFILDAPAEVPTVWGSGENVAWAEGEALWLVGPAGVGKTTLTGQIIRARIGLQPAVLDMPVTPDHRPVLYLAADRPRQIARAMRRTFRDTDRGMLSDSLIVNPGPPPFDLAAEPEALAAMAKANGAGTVVLDSAKDVALDLAKDETGSRFNRAIQLVLAEGIEVLVLHHQRKAQATNTKPRKLADVFGSVWLTAGAGSVLLLWGEPGDPVVELSTLKPAVGEIGPFDVVHDHERGTSTIHEGTDLLAIAVGSPSGLSVAEAAESLFGASPSKAQREKARRRLEALRQRGDLELKKTDDGTGRYSAREPRVRDRDPLTQEVTADHEPLIHATRNGSRGNTQGSTGAATPLRGRVPGNVPADEVLS